MKKDNFHTKLKLSKPFVKSLKDQKAIQQGTINVPVLSHKDKKVIDAGIVINLEINSKEIYKANRVAAYVTLVP